MYWFPRYNISFRQSLSRCQGRGRSVYQDSSQDHLSNSDEEEGLTRRRVPRRTSSEIASAKIAGRFIAGKVRRSRVEKISQSFSSIGIEWTQHPLWAELLSRITRIRAIFWTNYVICQAAHSVQVSPRSAILNPATRGTPAERKAKMKTTSCPSRQPLRLHVTSRHLWSPRRPRPTAACPWALPSGALKRCHTSSPRCKVRLCFLS